MRGGGRRRGRGKCRGSGHNLLSVLIMGVITRPVQAPAAQRPILRLIMRTARPNQERRRKGEPKKEQACAVVTLAAPPPQHSRRVALSARHGAAPSAILLSAKSKELVCARSPRAPLKKKPAPERGCCACHDARQPPRPAIISAGACIKITKEGADNAPETLTKSRCN